MNPLWINQKFVLNVNENVAAETRGHKVRVSVLAKALVGIDSKFAQCDIPFSCLKEEKVLEGWFPLHNAQLTAKASFKSSLNTLASVSEGSIKLRLQWIYTDSGLASYLLEATDRLNRFSLIFSYCNLTYCFIYLKLIYACSIL